MEIESEDILLAKVMWEDVEPRAEGTHLGEITESIMKSAGLWYKGKGFEDMNLTAEVGLLWERILSLVMRDKYATRPPQICEDGIWLSPDGIGPDPKGEAHIVVEEYKATWQSSIRPPADNFKYMVQIKSYCRAVNTNVAILHVFYINGNYRGSGPQYRRFRIVFSDWELEENWKMILRHRQDMEVK